MGDSRVVGVVDVSDSPTTPLLGTSTPPQPTTQPNYSPNPQILNYSTMEQQPQQQHMEERKDDAGARSSSAPPSSSNGLAGGDKVLLKSIEWNWNRMHTPSPQTTTLTQRSLSLTIGSKSTHFPLEDVIGVERQGSSLLVHSYPVDQGCCAGDRPIRKHSLTTLTPNQTTTNEQADRLVNAWHQQLESILNHTWMSQHPADDNRQRRSIMILINPASGAGNAAANLQTLTPMLKQSGISYQVMNTTHANHAFELMRDLNVDADDCPTDVVCVSGDGLVHEVINGMMQRPDWGKLVRRIRLGHIGGGSGNGLSSSICHQAGERIDIVSSMYLILKGYTRPFDVMSIKQDGEPLRYGFLSLSYGLISDIDLESESMRYLGNARFATAFLLRLCCRRQYEARIEYVPYDSTDSIEPGESRSYPLCQHAENGCPSCGIQYGGIQSTEVDHPQQRGRYELEQYIESITQDLNQIVIESNPAGSDDKGDVPSAAAAAAASSSSSSISPSSPPLRWYPIDDLFTLVWSMNVSHGASDLHVSPSSHFSDGCMDMLFVRDIGRCSSVSMFLKMEDGTHMTNSNLSKIKVRALRLQPNLKLRSDLNIDGERFPFKTMEMRVHRGVLNLLAR